jgi:cyclophilin family peptidyl-prolyl cis-trans isomerase
MKKAGIVILVIVLILVAVITFKMTGNVVNSSSRVKLETNMGDIVIELYPEKAPITVENFKTYVSEGFYSETIFHRVMAGFMIQGGGFDANTGKEKPTHEPIKLESNNGLENKRGTIAMARTPIPGSATAQFFINVVDNDFLNYGSRDEGYAVFGKVVEGMDVVDKIAKVETDSQDRPINEVKIIKATLI